MGTRILIGTEQGDGRGSEDRAVLFDSVTGWAFGPLFREDDDGNSAEDMAEMFLLWLRDNGHDDPRPIPPGDLEKLHGEWLKSR